ncbi:MAG: hypothetical protein Q7S00_08005, partial [bacterium]|nr:hypothetical protein [bacterium]
MLSEPSKDPGESVFLFSDHPLLANRTNKALLHLYQQHFLEDISSWAVGSQHFVHVTFRRWRSFFKDLRFFIRDLELGMAGGLFTLFSAFASFLLGAKIIRPHWSL